MERVNPKSRRDAYGSRINRAPSPTLVFLIPLCSILLGSLIPVVFIASAVPIIPPLGFLLLMSWRIIRPGIFPVWIGFPLGLFDDLFSGQPFGSAILLWSLAMIAIELIELRFPWRNFVQDWLTVAGFTAAYIIASGMLSGGEFDLPMLLAILPQIILSIALFPLISRLVARLDRLRLTRFRVVN
ncbi:rod shape-determining protein MreD [Accumulibacter sp.]|uniref:rod shape-determining protein MreD n=1 Tax=Accumulibacter sp. TaxID=2053492 RepID=UPI001D9009B7|nr:rod shape-determining protein MreD [Accumulibacter sp.]MCB2086471.1 rod shape-determining protein MreD [Sphingomonadaceae bacterium]MCP5227003.1 rod shape-determining protein MreD [Accumulibacter sp.]